MPRLPPPKHSQFKPGQSGNPAGGRAHNAFLQTVRRLTSSEIAEIGSLVLSKNMTALRRIALSAKNDPDTKHSALKSIVASAMLKAFAKGDMRTLNDLLDRIVGKVKDRIEVTGEDGGPVRSLVGQMTKEERAIELKRLKRMRLEAGDD